MTRRLVVPSDATQAQIVAIVAAIRTAGMGGAIDHIHKGLPAEIQAGWVRCNRAHRFGGCWYGAPRAGKCPRCGEGDLVTAVAPPNAVASFLVEDDHDVGDGDQRDELLAGLSAEDLQRLPPRLLRAIREQRQRILAIEARLAAAGVP